MSIEDAHEIDSAVISDGTKVTAGDLVIAPSWAGEGRVEPERVLRIMSEGDGEESGPCILTDSWGCYPSSFRAPTPEEV